MSLFLSAAGVSLTLISCDRLGACPATPPGSCLVACLLGHGWSGCGGVDWLDNCPTLANSAKWHLSMLKELLYTFVGGGSL